MVKTCVGFELPCKARPWIKALSTMQLCPEAWLCKEKAQRSRKCHSIVKTSNMCSLSAPVNVREMPAVVVAEGLPTHAWSRSTSTCFVKAVSPLPVGECQDKVESFNKLAKKVRISCWRVVQPAA